MSTVYVDARFRNALDALFDPASVTLSNYAGTIGVEVASTHVIVVADNIPMTRLGTGVYQYSFTAPSAGLTYTAYLEYVIGTGGDAETFYDSVTITDAPAASSGTATDLTLTEIRALVGRRAGYGTGTLAAEVQAEIDEQAQDVLDRIYNAGDWWWKRTKAASFVTVPDQDYIALPATFQALFLPAIYRTDKTAYIRVEDDPVNFDQMRAYWTATGQPVAGMIEWDATLDAPVLRLIPTPDAVYAYDLWYRRRSNALDATNPATTAADLPNLWRNAYKSAVTVAVCDHLRGKEMGDRYRAGALADWRAAMADEARQPLAAGSGPPLANYDLLLGGAQHQWPLEVLGN